MIHASRHLPRHFQQRLDAVEGRAGVQTRLLVEGELNLPATIESELYHSAQEALNNVIKHARAQRARVALRFEGRGLVLEVQDDGIGFEPRRIPAGHMGIGIMRERAQGIGARLSIRSTRASGTCLQLRWTG